MSDSRAQQVLDAFVVTVIDVARHQGGDKTMAPTITRDQRVKTKTLDEVLNTCAVRNAAVALNSTTDIRSQHSGLPSTEDVTSALARLVKQLSILRRWAQDGLERGFLVEQIRVVESCWNRLNELDLGLWEHPPATEPLRRRWLTYNSSLTRFHKTLEAYIRLGVSYQRLSLEEVKRLDIGLKGRPAPSESCTRVFLGAFSRRRHCKG